MYYSKVSIITASWELWKHPDPAPGGRPMFFKAKLPKESKNGFKTINYRCYPVMIFSKNCFQSKKCRTVHMPSHDETSVPKWLLPKCQVPKRWEAELSSSNTNSKITFTWFSSHCHGSEHWRLFFLSLNGHFWS